MTKLGLPRPVVDRVSAHLKSAAPPRRGAVFFTGEERLPVRVFDETATKPLRQSAPRPGSVRHLLWQLTETFPAAFDTALCRYERRKRWKHPQCLPATPRAFKGGIHHDIAQRLPDVEPAKIKRALNRYCAENAYLEALAAPGALRIDLDGQLCGEVSANDAARARGWLEKRERDKAARADHHAEQEAERE